MIFDDVFYPGNPKRRKEVADLQADIKKSYNDYKSAWNELVSILNPALETSRIEGWEGFQLKSLFCTIENDTLGDCIKEINETISESKEKLTDLVKAIKLDGELPEDWETKGAKLEDVDYNQWIARGVFSGVSIALAGFIAFYAFRGITIAIALVSMVAEITVSLGVFIGGAMLSAVVGAATFVISDMIFSAITGAIERKKLNDAISALKEIKKQFAEPLDSAFRSLSGILSQMKTGMYPLDEKHWLVKDSKGNYVIFEKPMSFANGIHANGIGENAMPPIRKQMERLLETGEYKILIPAS